jgi:hypothetical protein
MKINSIETSRKHENLELSELKITIDFNASNSEDLPDGDALYYLICALEKCSGKSFKDLDFIQRMEVSNRLDAAYHKISELKRELDKYE